jgi:hypothetical protein
MHTKSTQKCMCKGKSAWSMYGRADMATLKGSSVVFKHFNGFLVQIFLEIVEKL